MPRKYILKSTDYGLTYEPVPLDLEPLQDLDKRYLEKLYSRLDNTKIKTGQKIETPDEKTPESEFNGQRIRETVFRARG